jgi:hypothetical protein
MNQTVRPPSSEGFLVGFFVFLSVGLLAFLVSSEVLVRWVLLPRDNYPQYLEVLRNETAETVAIGNSMLANGLVGGDDLVNLAYVGAKVVDFVNRAEIYIRRANLKQVVLQANPVVLADAEGDRQFEFNTRSVEGRGIGAYCLLPNYRTNLLKHWIKYVRGDAFAGRTPVLPRGGQLLSSDSMQPLQEQLADMKGLLQRTLPLQGCSGSANAKKYRLLVERLSAAGGRIILVSPPVHPDYLQRVKDEPGYIEAIHFFERLAAECNGVFLDQAGLSLTGDGYYDMTHLNERGAKLYTEFLLKTLHEMGRSKTRD